MERAVLDAAKRQGFDRCAMDDVSFVLERALPPDEWAAVRACRVSIPLCVLRSHRA